MRRADVERIAPRISILGGGLVLSVVVFSGAGILNIDRTAMNAATIDGIWKIHLHPNELSVKNPPIIKPNTKPIAPDVATQAIVRSRLRPGGQIWMMSAIAFGIVQAAPRP